jgi:hypothetical protein
VLATVRIRSRPFAQTGCFQRFPFKSANATEPERTPNLAILATESGDEMRIALRASPRNL